MVHPNAAVTTPTPSKPLKGAAVIVAERRAALARVLSENWKQSTRGVAFGASRAFFTHCSPGEETPVLVCHMRERVGATAPQGVRLAQLVERIDKVPKEEVQGLLRQAVVEAEILLSRLNLEG